MMQLMMQPIYTIMQMKLVLLVLLLLTDSYTAQETPAFYEPDWSNYDTHRNEFCEQHAAVERGDIQLRNALQGLDITVGFFGYQLNEQTGAIDVENPNIAIDFLDELAKRAGFSFRNSYGKIDPPNGNVTWSDILYLATDIYDVVGDWYIESTTRLERNMIYPDGWYDANFIMVEVKGQSAEFDFFSFAAPFTPGLWGLIALTTVVSGVVYYILDYFDSRIKGRPMDMGLENSLFFTAFLMKGHYAHKPKSRSTRILVFSMSFFFFVVVACYTANLASFLVLKNRQVNINDIQDVIRNDMTFCVERDTPQDEFLQSFRIQPRNLVRTSGDADFDGSSFRALLDGQCDLILTTKGTFDSFRRTKEYNPDCNLEQVGRIQKIQSAGFVLKDSEHYCASIVRDVLHLHMLEMKETGIYDMIWESFLSKATTNSCNTINAGNEDGIIYDGLGIANLSGMFALHTIGVLIAFGITLVSFCMQPKHRRKAMISELYSGIFGNTTLNRAVVSAANNRRKSVFSFSKTSASALGNLPPPPPPSHSTKMESADGGVDDAEPSRVVASAEEWEETDEAVKTKFYSLMEQNQEQKMMIEYLLQRIEKMDERSYEMNQRSQQMDERSQIMDKRSENIDTKVQKLEDKMVERRELTKQQSQKMDEGDEGSQTMDEISEKTGIP